MNATQISALFFLFVAFARVVIAQPTVDSDSARAFQSNRQIGKTRGIARLAGAVKVDFCTRWIQRDDHAERRF